MPLAIFKPLHRSGIARVNFIGPKEPTIDPAVAVLERDHSNLQVTSERIATGLSALNASQHDCRSQSIS